MSRRSRANTVAILFYFVLPLLMLAGMLIAKALGVAA